MRYDNSVSSRVVAVIFSGSIATRSDFGARPSEHPDIQNIRATVSFAGILLSS